jgi:parvulin-like peptidyl-prolyl isomerase
MENPSSIVILNQEIIDFLRRNLRLQKIYREMISQRVVTDVAQEVGQIVDEEEIQQELDGLLYEYRLDHPSKLVNWAADHLATLGDVRQMVSEELLSQKLARHLFLEQAQEQFQQQYQNFETIAIYKIQVPYEKLAREIFYQIEEEEISFFEAAHIYDIDSKRRLQCGFEGRMQRWQLPPDIAELLKNTPVGKVVGPYQTIEGHFMLLLIDDLLAPELIPETLDQIIDYLFQEWLAERVEVHLNRLKNNVIGRILGS